MNGDRPHFYLEEGYVEPLSNLAYSRTRPLADEITPCRNSSGSSTFTLSPQPNTHERNSGVSKTCNVISNDPSFFWLQLLRSVPYCLLHEAPQFTRKSKLHCLHFPPDRNSPRRAQIGISVEICGHGIGGWQHFYRSNTLHLERTERITAVAITDQIDGVRYRCWFNEIWIDDSHF